MSEGEKELPQGWANSCLGEMLTEIRGGGTPSKAIKEYFEGNIPLMTVKDMKVRKPSAAGFNITQEALDNSSAKLIPADTIVIATRMGLGKVIRPRVDTAINQDLKALFPTGALNKDLLEKWVMSNASKLEGMGTGTTVKGIRLTQLREMKFVIPPLAEQARIVDKIDELFSSIEAGERAIARARTALKRYRKAVLKAAVTGELTADWRAKNPPNETAQDLLARILKARYNAWEKAELEKLDTKGKARPKTEKEWAKFRARYKVPVEPEIEGLTELPHEWAWTSLSTISHASSYGTSSKCSYEFTGVAVMRIPNVRGMSLNLQDLKFAKDTEKLTSKGLLEKGDLLIIRTNGSSKIVGLGAVVLEAPTIPCYFASYLIRFRLCFADDLSRWINVYWQTEYVRKFVRKHAATSAGQYNVSMTNLGSFPVPLPPLAEQAEIVSRVEQALSKADKAEATLSAQAKQAKALKQAVLKTAFEGKLVPQNPNDEPASELLKRIKAAS